jgi:UDP-N-acetylmuramate--alanine ligase
MDPEHLDFYGSVEALHDAFEVFVENIPFYGVAILCIDHPVVQALIGRIEDRRVITYGFSPQADVRGLNLRAAGGEMHFDVEITGRDPSGSQRIEGFTLPMLGEHNVLNALAAIAVAHEMGIPADKSRSGLARFGGVKRRFTKTGETRGITVIDDYGHHPVEIAAVLKAARQATGGATGGKVIAVVQPHRYTRLAELFEEFCACFNDADHVIVSEVYAAGEEPIESADRDALVGGMRARGHRNVTALTDVALLAPLVSELAQSGDLVVCLGAGNITAWANALPQELEAVYAAKDAAKDPRAAETG